MKQQKIPLKDLKLHPIFEFLQNESKGEFPSIPDLLQRIRPGDTAVQVTTDNMVVSGIGLVNIARRKGLETIGAGSLAFDSGNPQALIVALREIARCTALSLGEAKRVKHNHRKVASGLGERSAAPQITELQVYGLIDEFFKLYRAGNENGRIPHFQAVILSRDFPPEAQQKACEAVAKNPTRALECVKACLGKEKPPEQGNAGKKKPGNAASPEALVDRILQNPAAREALFNRLTDLIVHPLEAFQFRQIVTSIEFKKEKEGRTRT